MGRNRSLVVVADDYGIGPETSRGILELAQESRITATVLLVNSPFAEQAVSEWNRAGRPVEIGWHPCLTLDSPVLPAEKIPTLVNSRNHFWPLGQFLRRLYCGLIRLDEVAAEFRAQRQRFHDLLGHWPTVVNSHQHIAVFPPIGRLLRKLLSDQSPAPFVRRVVEPMATMRLIPGARLKRFVLTSLGRRAQSSWSRRGFQGCRWLAGITDPPWVANERFFVRWLMAIQGESVELMCHPGYHDETLIGRDCMADKESTARRPHELQLLRAADFFTTARRYGFRLTAPSEFVSPNRVDSAA